MDVVVTDKGGIIKISADQMARDSLAAADDTFRIGASGLGKFTEAGRRMETLRQETREDNARAKVEALRRSLAVAEKKLSEAAKQQAADDFLSKLNIALPGQAEDEGNITNNMDTQSSSVSGSGDGDAGNRAQLPTASPDPKGN